ncbi:MAG: hypothetical protein QM237_08250 [Bacteroidota bacterium]|jgi:hypothetical protein|nr:hypothetical protein [Bacteroidota bacterium]HHU97475.1 hypothetical protein [Petrimonas sp.]
MKQVLLSFLFICAVMGSTAQDITTTWPYLYSDFKDGTVYFTSKTTLAAPLNVHLLKSSLHYLDNEQVKEVTTSDIAMVIIGEDNYYARDNQLMRVISGDSTGFVAELVLADIDALTQSGGAYGSSSNVQATRKLSSLEVGGIHVTNHMELKNNKDNGTLLPVKTTYYIVTTKAVYHATRRGMESLLPDHAKSDLRRYVKQHNVKWNRPETYHLLLDFLKELPDE